jgi:hypothetical protein
MNTLSVRALIVVTVLAAASTTASGQSPGPPAAGGDEALIGRLEGTVVDAEYAAEDFEDVIDDLRERYDLNIHVSWKLLDKLGIRKDKRLEVRLRQVSLATLLEMILREAEPEYNELAYTVEGGVILISLRSALVRNTVLRAYDITDLIESGYAIRRFGNTPVLSLALTGREFLGGEKRRVRLPDGRGGGGTAGGGRMFGDPGEAPSRLTQLERIQQVIDLLTQNIDPDDWAVNGGNIASIHAFNGVLLIRHTIDGHRRVKGFFDLIRASLPRPLDGEAIVVRLRADKAAEWRRSLEGRFPRLTSKDAGDLAATGEAGGVLFRATTSGFNGQVMWFSALTQRDVVTSMEAQTAQQVNAFSPVTGFSTEGLELTVLPLLCAAGDAMLLDVQMAWVPTADVIARDVTLAGGEAKGSIDQTRRSMRTVSTSAKVGLGEAIALSIPSQLDDAGRVADYEDWLIVHVRPPADSLPEAHAAAIRAE